MVFSTLTAAAAFSFFSLVSSAPTSSPIYPPTSLSQNFRLVANVTSGPLLINNYVLTSYHTGAGEAFAVLQPNTTVTSGRIFYVNGTATDVRYNQANVLSDEGTPLYPGGVLINPPNEAGERAVSINAGSGEAGIGLTNFPNPIKELYAGEGAGFYACDNELEYGEAVQVLFRELGETTPEGCSDVSLLPQCSEGSGLEHPYGNTVNCYADVASIDWAYYNTY